MIWVAERWPEIRRECFELPSRIAPLNACHRGQAAQHHRSPLLSGQPLLSEGHSNAHQDALYEWSCRRFAASGVPILWMRRRMTAELPVLF